MPSKTSKTYSEYYKNDLALDQSSNTGITAVTTKIQDGDGKNTAISLSDDVLAVQPVTDNTVGTMLVKNKSGSNILSVDTSNSRVLCGSSQVDALTQYAYFSVSQMDVATSHIMIPFQSSHSFGATDSSNEVNLGTGTNPATTLDVSGETNTNEFSNCFWYIPDAITIRAVHILVSGSQASTTDNLDFHLNKYSFDTTSNLGDLSSGVVIADQSAVITDVHQDAIKYKSLTVDASNNNDAAGQVVILTVKSTGSTEISCNATVKFSIQ